MFICPFKKKCKALIKYHFIKNVIIKSLLVSAFFVLLFQSLELLYNIVEDSKQNIATLVQLRTSPCLESQEVDNQGDKISAIEALVQLFLIREKAARNTDEMTSGLSTEGNLFNPLTVTKILFLLVCSAGLFWVDESCLFMFILL